VGKATGGGALGHTTAADSAMEGKAMAQGALAGEGVGGDAPLGLPMPHLVEKADGATEEKALEGLTAGQAP
jgi:hypothetical protein